MVVRKVVRKTILPVNGTCVAHSSLTDALNDNGGARGFGPGRQLGRRHRESRVVRWIESLSCLAEDVCHRRARGGVVSSNVPVPGSLGAGLVLG